MLRYTSFLFGVAVLVARQDPFYHGILLALTSVTIARHWGGKTDSVIASIDRGVAHGCFGLCAYSHLYELPSALGATCVFLILCLWAYEYLFPEDWVRAHVILHGVAFTGIMVAIENRRPNYAVTIKM